VRYWVITMSIAERGKNGFDNDFRAFITEGAWGAVWSRPA
jgi:hypothetical protein